MFIRRTITAVAAFALLSGGIALLPGAASAHDESEFEHLVAPFECDTEWAGGTRGGHGQNDWNLDINRTSLVWPDRQHDLGQPLLAQGDGVVAYVGLHVNAGTYLDIDYGHYTVRYVHLVHDSIPAGVDQRGDIVRQGDLIGLIGDTGNATGHAHLHLEYWDSREMEVAEGWRLRNAGYPQTEVTFDGNVIDPGEVFVSTNCVDRPADTVLGAHVQPLTDPETALDYLLTQLADSTEALDGTTDPAAFLDETAGGTNVFARIPGTDLAGETVLVSTSYTSPSNCGAEEAPIPCAGATEHAASTALVLELAASLSVAPAPPRRTIVFSFWDDSIGAGQTAQDWVTAYTDTARTDIVAAVDYGVTGANATLELRPDTLVSLTSTSEWPSLDESFASRATTLHRFAGSSFVRPAATALAAAPFPVLAFSDVAGPCVGSPADVLGVVDEAKLGTQLGEAIAMVEDLASTDAPTTPTAPDAAADLLADADALLTLAAAASHLPAAYAELQALVDEPPAPIEPTHHAVLEDALQHFTNTIAAESCRGSAAPEPFTDISPASFALADASLLFDLGITTGTSPTSYSPRDDVTREQMAAFIARVWRLVHPDAAPSEPDPFVDVSAGSFAREDINLIWELGITTGTGDTYNPGDVVTRRQMAAFLSRLWLLLHPGLEPTGAHPFTDIDPDGYAAPHIGLIYSLGITTGTSATTYSPDQHVTREQMAAFLGRVIRALAPAAG